LFQDPRRDSLVERETTVDDDFRLDLLVGYGIKPWLSVQLDASYFSTDLIQFDTFAAQNRYVDNGDNVLIYSAECNCVTEERELTQSQPFVPAEVTQIPITASAVFRFWPERVWNLYLTAGVGYVFIDIDETERFDELNRIITNERMLQLSTQQIPLSGDPNQALLEELYVIETTVFALDQPEAITIEAEDSMQYTLGVGGNYFINSNWAMDFEIRYLLMEQDIKIDVSGNDQLNYVYVSPDNLPGCGNGFLFSEDDFPPDFDRFNMGIVDMCRPSNAFPLLDQVLVQGGTIDLSAWVFRLGVRYVF
jgi:opacity protein-like surface antigen